MADPVSAEWIVHLQADPVAGLGALFEAHRDRLWRMLEVRLNRRVSGRIGPEDVIQEAYLDASARLDGFLANPAVPVYVWLRGVVFQRMLTLERSHLAVKGRAVGREQVTPAGAATADSMAGLLAGNFTSPTQALARGELQARIHAALDAMEPLDREVLALRHFEELSNADAAAVLGLEPSAASKRHVRALRRLKAVMEE